MNQRKNNLKDAIGVLEIRLQVCTRQVLAYPTNSKRKDRKLYAEIAHLGRALEVLRNEYLYWLEPIESKE